MGQACLPELFCCISISSRVRLLLEQCSVRLAPSNRLQQLCSILYVPPALLMPKLLYYSNYL
jgi:hypothetical protein